MKVQELYTLETYMRFAANVKVSVILTRNRNPKKKKTEQEWLQTADTEELAEFLNQVFHARAFCEICEIRKRCKFRAGCKYGNKPYKECWKEWLRQPHHENK